MLGGWGSRTRGSSCQRRRWGQVWTPTKQCSTVDGFFVTQPRSIANSGNSSSSVNQFLCFTGSWICFLNSKAMCRSAGPCVWDVWNKSYSEQIHLACASMIANGLRDRIKSENSLLTVGEQLLPMPVDCINIQVENRTFKPFFDLGYPRD